MTRSDHLPPQRWKLARESLALGARLWRAFGRLGERGPAGGEPLMVAPGFLATDRTTLGLQRALAEAGYRVSGWSLGWNRGARADTLDRLTSAIERFGGGRPVVLVGWSLGGIFARAAANCRPDLLARVITLGAPFSGDPRANNVWRLYEFVAGHPVDAPPLEADYRTKPPVPTAALWSRQDGIVAPAAARGLPHESDRQVELGCTHMGFAVAASAYPAIVAAVGQLAKEGSRR